MVDLPSPRLRHGKPAYAEATAWEARLRTTGILKDLKAKTVVFLVCADPEPVIMTVSLASQGAVAPTDLDSINCAFLAKAKRRMPRISLKQSEIFIRKPLDMRGEQIVASPERLQRV
jgi:hypothetical protein